MLQVTTETELRVVRPSNPPLTFRYDDGGRAAAGFKGYARDCVVRAIAIATCSQDCYRDIYDDLHALQKAWVDGRPMSARHRSPRNGVYPEVYKPFLARWGWRWVPTMHIGSGTTVHLAAGELPDERLIVRLSGHLCATAYGSVFDTSDPCRGGARCVYGYWTQGSASGS